MTEAVQHPLTFEIVGVAGTGKSTLARLLAQQPALFAPGNLLYTRRPAALPAVVRHFLGAIPVLWQQPQLSWTEIKLMIYLDGWQNYLVSPEKRFKHIYLDQGPVYSLARLGTIAPPLDQLPAYVNWRRQVMQRWAQTLDLIICLDAPDAVLSERIHGRQQAHEVKSADFLTVSHFLQQYRREYGRITRQLNQQFGVKLLTFDTSKINPGQLQQAIMQAIAPTAPQASSVLVS